MLTPPKGMTLASLVLAGTLVLVATPPVLAAPDPIIEICSSSGCNTASTLLAPCGGGATNSSIQQNFTYTVTPVLGSCECNSQFFNAFSQCLACIASQAKSLPVIDTQQNWEADCKTYGFNFTAAPINYTAPIAGPGSDAGGKGGLGGGAIAGIVIAVLALAAAAAGFMFFRNRKRRTKNGIFERPFTVAGAGSGGYEPTPSQPSFNAHTSYHNGDYSDSHGGGYMGQDQDQYTNYGGYSQNPNPTLQEQHYGSGQNDDEIMMSNMQHSTYIPPPAPMSAAAVAAVGHTLGSPRPSDAYPQSLRNKNKDWDSRQHEFSSDLVSTDQLLHNDKAVYEDGEELEPPRSRDRYVNDRDDFTNRRSLTPPRANMQSYRDEYARPSFDREPRRNSGSERGSLSGLNLARTGGGGGASGLGYDSSNEDESNTQESPETARRRRAAELFSAEGTRR
ncbi:hypothetical protein EDD11_002865 [Mortierella claussenii]|nr:hypothetical protein EDD11_002865 [Mortierella claussenii]